MIDETPNSFTALNQQTLLIIGLQFFGYFSLNYQIPLTPKRYPRTNIHILKCKFWMISIQVRTQPPIRDNSCTSCTFISSLNPLLCREP